MIFTADAPPPYAMPMPDADCYARMVWHLEEEGERYQQARQKNNGDVHNNRMAKNNQHGEVYTTALRGDIVLLLMFAALRACDVSSDECYDEYTPTRAGSTAGVWPDTPIIYDAAAMPARQLLAAVTAATKIRCAPSMSPCRF